MKNTYMLVYKYINNAYYIISTKVVHHLHEFLISSIQL